MCAGFPVRSPAPWLALLATCLGLALALLTSAAGAQERRIDFRPSAEAPLNPERGFWRQGGDDFLNGPVDTDTVLSWARPEGVTVVQAIVRLDAWRDRDLPRTELDRLDAAFAAARDRGVKLILRFAYNFEGSDDCIAAPPPDAPLPIVLRHIRQLAPVLRRNADTLVAIQAGFIGAWGEGHCSANGLDRPSSKRRIRDAMLRHFPAEVPLQWRRPPDLIAWGAARGRFGFYNDCFLASDTDVGTYADDPMVRAGQRAAMHELTRGTWHSGETCENIRAPDQMRLSCAAILGEGAMFHLSSLNGWYWQGFHAAWTAGGCRTEVSQRLGYRLVLDHAVLNPASGAVSVTIANHGWAAVRGGRRLVLDALAGPTILASVDLGALALAAPDGTVTFRGTLPAGLAANRWCLRAPDPSPRLDRGAARALFAIRFANADQGGQQRWEPRRAAFCFR